MKSVLIISLVAYLALAGAVDNAANAVASKAAETTNAEVKPVNVVQTQPTTTAAANVATDTTIPPATNTGSTTTQSDKPAAQPPQAKARMFGSWFGSKATAKDKESATGEIETKPSESTAQGQEVNKAGFFGKIAGWFRGAGQSVGNFFGRITGRNKAPTTQTTPPAPGTSGTDTSTTTPQVDPKVVPGSTDAKPSTIVQAATESKDPAVTVSREIKLPTPAEVKVQGDNAPSSDPKTSTAVPVTATTDTKAETAGDTTNAEANKSATTGQPAAKQGILSKVGGFFRGMGTSVSNFFGRITGRNKTAQATPAQPSTSTTTETKPQTNQQSSSATTENTSASGPNDDAAKSATGNVETGAKTETGDTANADATKSAANGQPAAQKQGVLSKVGGFFRGIGTGISNFWGRITGRNKTPAAPATPAGSTTGTTGATDPKAQPQASGSVAVDSKAATTVVVNTSVLDPKQQTNQVASDTAANTPT